MKKDILIGMLLLLTINLVFRVYAQEQLMKVAIQTIESKQSVINVCLKNIDSQMAKGVE